MARPVPMSNHRIGPVAECPTRGRCNVLFPGSTPGRASTLRPDGLRVAQPRGADRAKRVRRSLSNAKAKTDWSRKAWIAKAGSIKLARQQNTWKITVDGPFLGLRSQGIWSKDPQRARASLTLVARGTR